MNYERVLHDIEYLLEELQQFSANLSSAIKVTLGFDDFIASGFALIKKIRGQIATVKLSEDDFKHQIAELIGEWEVMVRQAQDIKAQEGGRYSPRFLSGCPSPSVATPAIERANSTEVGVSQLITALVAGEAQIKNLSIGGDVTIIGQQTIVHLGEHALQTASESGIIKWQLPPRARVCPGRFVTRSSLFEQIRKKFDSLKIVDASWVLMSFSGLGGVGKTYLVTYLVHKAEEILGQHYSFYAWFHAHPISQLENEYLALGEELQIFTADMSHRRKISTVKNWLEQKSLCCLVYDNVDEREFGTVQTFLPDKNAHIFLTSRNPCLDNDIPVKRMLHDEAVELIANLTAQGITPEMSSLAEVLGNFPLALAQAGAYIRRTRSSIASYLKLYQEAVANRRQLLAHQTAGQTTLPIGDEHDSVYITWDINVHEIEKSEVASKIFHLCSYLQADGVPRAFLLRFVTEVTETDRNLILNDALALIFSYSMMDADEEQEVVSMHPLVQEITRDKHSREVAENLLQEAALQLHAEYRENDSGTQQGLSRQRLLSVSREKALESFKALKLFNIHDSKYREITGALLQDTAQFFVHTGDMEKQMWQLCMGFSFMSEADDPGLIAQVTDHMAALGSNLPSWEELRQQVTRQLEAQARKGLEMRQEVWRLTRQLFKNPLLAVAKEYYGASDQCQAIGEMHLALFYLLRSLETIWQLSIIPDHKLMVDVLNALSAVHNAFGDQEGKLNYCRLAITYAEKTEAIILPVLYSQLGEEYRDQHQLKLAVTYLQMALSKQLAIHGENHQRTYQIGSDLGYVYSDLGQMEMAKDCLEKLLKIASKSLFSITDPSIRWLSPVDLCKILGWVAFCLGDMDQAQQCTESGLSFMADVEVTQTNPNLYYVIKAHLYFHQALLSVVRRDFEKAEKDYQQALQCVKQIQLEKLSSVLPFLLGNLGKLYHQWGKLAQAEFYLKEASQKTKPRLSRICDYANFLYLHERYAEMLPMLHMARDLDRGPMTFFPFDGDWLGELWQSSLKSKTYLILDSRCFANYLLIKALIKLDRMAELSAVLTDFKISVDISEYDSSAILLSEVIALIKTVKSGDVSQETLMAILLSAPRMLAPAVSFVADLALFEPENHKLKASFMIKEYEYLVKQLTAADETQRYYYEVHLYLAKNYHVRNTEGDEAVAEREFQIVLQHWLTPSICFTYGLFLFQRERYVEAATVLQQALALNQYGDYEVLRFDKNSAWGLQDATFFDILLVNILVFEKQDLTNLTTCFLIKSLYAANQQTVAEKTYAEFLRDIEYRPTVVGHLLLANIQRFLGHEEEADMQTALALSLNVGAEQTKLTM